MTKGTIERAFELASTCEDLDAIRSTLRREGYSNVDAHLAGRVIQTDLRKILKRSSEASGD
jgi:hypothetical protein